MRLKNRTLSKISMKYLFIILLLSSLLSCDIKIPNISNTSDTSNSLVAKGTKIKGKASYYATKFNGRPTASGQKFDNNLLTAAHKTFAFNTKVNVKNLKNNKSVIVIINDRLPKTSSRDIDLSQSAARALDMIKDGIAQVEITIL